jgi:hypothetical protein
MHATPANAQQPANLQHYISPSLKNRGPYASSGINAG